MPTSLVSFPLLTPNYRRSLPPRKPQSQAIGAATGMLHGPDLAHTGCAGMREVTAYIPCAPYGLRSGRLMSAAIGFSSGGGKKKCSLTLYGLENQP